MHEIIELDDRGLRKFGLTTGAIVVVLFGLLIPWLFDLQWPRWPWILAALLWVPALVYPRSLNPVYRGWMKFGLVVGAINTRIVLGLVFYLVLAPIGLFMRLFGRDILERRPSEDPSYRKPSQARTSESMEKPF